MQSGAVESSIPLEALRRVADQLDCADPAQVQEMEGGASTRRFFRLPFRGGESGIAMYVPDASQPDEISNGAERGRRWPFLEVRELLEARGVRVPRLLHEACDEKMIVVEDLGDDTLARYLERCPERREHLYKSAIRDLCSAQEALGELPSDSVVSERAFDRELLRWEIDHFREWALEARGIALSEAQQQRFDHAAHYLAESIASWPRGFVHRDYQSRNLMVREVDGVPELVWIDFQDALLGPRVYDLVALLNDSYQRFSRAFIEERLDEYSTHLGHSPGERRTVGREFDMVTVQRKLKDAGRFIFIDEVRGNPSFLQFVEPTIAKAQKSLARLTDDPNLADLAQLLDELL